MIAKLVLKLQTNTKLFLICTGIALLFATTSHARETLRVCADPNNLPFSNQQQEGFENKIAQLFADSLGIPLEYTWFPQRRGFVRHTLRSQDPISGQYKCDLVMGMPVQFELGIVTKPYYRSTWTLVYRKDSALAELSTAEDLFALPEEVKQELKIGVFDQTPGGIWLGRQGLHQQIIGYPTLNADPDEFPGQIIARDLQNKTLDAAIVWGPIGGFFVAQDQTSNLALLPLTSDAMIKFDFALAMAVRFGDKEWRDQVQELIDQHQQDIETILTEYHVPLLPIGDVKVKNDDD